MYTTTPVVDLNNVHSGFWFVLFVCIIINVISILFSLVSYFDESKIYGYSKRNTTFKGWWKQANEIKIIACLLVVVLFISGYVSYFKEYPVPKNEQVIAELVDLDTKMVNKNFGSSKHPQWKSVQQGFLVYSTPDGYLTLPNTHLQIVHPKIILYKN